MTATLPAWPTPVRTVRPYLGVSFNNVGADAQTRQPSGALVGRVVAGGPARRAGLRVGDVIFRADGQDLGPELTLNDAVNLHVPGEVIELTIWRDGRELSFLVTLDTAQEYVFLLSPIQHELQRVGLSLLEVADGLVVEHVAVGSPAHEAGLMVGDLVVAMNGETELNGDTLTALLNTIAEGQAITVMVKRDSVRHQFTITVSQELRP
ncbi:MAG: PDZ domain-containing protein [Anaerolineae bacterium]|nr:PDZ domain-containing protein [Anaerolineae bacterium]